MLDGLRQFIGTVRYRVRRVERRELRDLHAWLEETTNLLHLTILLVVPLLIGAITLLANEVRTVSFLLYPPLASGAYTLFMDPEGRYASPTAFVGGMTAGAVCGWVAVELAAGLYQVPPTRLDAHAGAAALSIALTAVVTWSLDVETPAAFSTALLVLITGTSQLAYVVGVFLSSAVVGVAFAAWRGKFYERRASFLYRTVESDDRVLVPARGSRPEETAMFAARLAAPHDVSKVVLLDAAEDEDGETAAALEARADRVESRTGVRSEVAVVDGELDAGTTLDAAAETNCDLVVAPFETDGGRLSGYVRALFDSEYDVVSFRSTGDRREWRRPMVAANRAGETAHAMVDYAARLAGAAGSVGVCTCIDRESGRRRAESMLAGLVETVEARCETRVARSSVEAFIERNDAHYDVVFVGASTDRGAASRFLSPPTFERLGDVAADVAVVHPGRV